MHFNHCILCMFPVVPQFPLSPRLFRRGDGGKRIVKKHLLFWIFCHIIVARVPNGARKTQPRLGISVWVTSFRPRVAR